MYDIELSKYIVYGLTPCMQDCIKSGFHDLRSHPMTDVLQNISEDPTFSQEEKNLILFEIGRAYERGGK